MSDRPGAVRVNGEELDEALRWALVRFRVDIYMLDARSPIAVEAAMHVWPDQFQAYATAIRTIRQLCGGQLDPREYLSQQVGGADAQSGTS